MRVLAIGSLYPPHSFGGAELIWYSAVGHLRSRGHEVRILTTDLRLADPDPDIAEDADAHRELGWYWREHEFPRLSLGRRLALERRNIAIVERHLREFRPQCVNWWSMGGMSLSLLEVTRRRGLPAAGVVCDEWMGYAPQVDQWQRAVERAGLPGRLVSALARVPAPVDIAAAARWVFLSETLRRTAARGGVEPAASRVVPAGIDLSLFRPAPAAPWRGRLLYVGRIDLRKGVATAIRALAELPGEWQLTLIGPGDPRVVAELGELALAEGVAGRVRFERRSRRELPAAYGAADVLLFPTLWEEPHGMVPLEAMATGTPVVATGTGGSGEYLRDGENCLLFSPPGDAVALAKAVTVIAADERLRGRLRAGGLETAARYSDRILDEVNERELSLAMEHGAPSSPGG